MMMNEKVVGHKTNNGGITDLVPGTKYNCMVVAVAPKDQLMYSDIISRIAV
jgi:hypothetical protein